MNESYLPTLAREFRAGEVSFLLQLRVNLHWDKKAFGRLTEAMRLCCKHYQYSQEQLDSELKGLREEQYEDEEFADAFMIQRQYTLLPRWLAEGFWYLSHFVRDWTSHPAWEQTIAQEPAYFQNAYELLDDLAAWFFDGQCPWIDEEKGWAQLQGRF